MSWPQWQPNAQQQVPALINPAANSAMGLSYTPEQWQQMQQQNWQQWAQWQQQYQQWHQQYGAEYQKSLSAMANTLATPPLPTLPSLPTQNMAVPPPLPKEKPPLPPDEPPSTTSKFSPPFTSARSTVNHGLLPKPPLPVNNGPNLQNLQMDKTMKRPAPLLMDPVPDIKRNKIDWSQNQALNPASIKPLMQIENNRTGKGNEMVDELPDAEKKFVKQFAEWEAQFKKWKDQNQDHPDKAQYREYEKKWEAWRNQLLERRDLMRRKRLGFTPPAEMKSNPLFQENISGSNNSLGPPIIPMITPDKMTPENEPAPLFKPASTGIPGLDLVDAKGSPEKPEKEQVNIKGPALEELSKNINSILGDQKLLSMLSLVASQNPQLINKTPNPESPIIKVPEIVPSTDFENKPLERETIIPIRRQNSNEFNVNRPNSNEFNANRQNSNEFNVNRQNSNEFNANRQNSNEFNVNNFNSSENFMNRPNISTNYNVLHGNHSNHSTGDGFQCTNDMEPPQMNQMNDYRGNFDNVNNFNDNDQRVDHGENFNENIDHYEQQRWEHPEHDVPRNFNEMPSMDLQEEEIREEAPDAPMIQGEDFDDLLNIETVINYEHKSKKQDTFEVTVIPPRLFDYRHKLVTRIPLPERPKWLTETYRNIPEFNPPIQRPPPVNRFENRPFQAPIDRYYDQNTFNRRPQHFNSNNNRPPPMPMLSSMSEQAPVLDHVISGKQPLKPDFYNRRMPGPQHFERRNFPIMMDHDDDHDMMKMNPAETRHDPVVTSVMTSRSTTVFIDDILSPPGRHRRPNRIVIILRGPPGSGKTFLAKLIKDKETEFGGSAPRILSLGDYFMVEQEAQVEEDGKMRTIKEMVYKYEECMESSYSQSLLKSFKKTITDGYFNFVIVDNVNDKVKHFKEMWSFAKQNGFQVYVCQLEMDVQICTKRNTHSRTESEIRQLVSNWEALPNYFVKLDATNLVQAGSIPEVEMEEINSPNDFFDDVDGDDNEIDEDRSCNNSSKWDKFECSDDNLAKLDGVGKILRSTRTLEDYLQLDDEWTTPSSAKPGQKRVRWADLEERKQQEKMRAIGFVVGQTDWDRMMDPTQGGAALTQTKFIERVGTRKLN